MKILLINKFHYRKGGAETVYFDTADIFIKQGNDVHFFSTNNKENVGCNDKKYFIKYRDYSKGHGFFKNIDSFFNMLYSFEAKRNLKKMIKDVGPFDVAYLHNIYHQISPSIIKVLKKNNIRVVMVIHDLKIMCPNYKMVNGKNELCEKCKGGKYYNCVKYKCVKNSFTASLACTIEAYFHKFIKAYKGVDLFITPSIFMRNKMIEYGFSETRVIHVNNPVKNLDDSIESTIGDYYLFIGRLAWEKGADFIIKTFAKIGDKKLIIAGDGPQFNDLQKFISDNGIKNVELVGFKSGEDLKRLILKSKAVILPSTVPENQPMSIIEAFSLKKLAIGSNIGGIPELIGDNERGLLFNVNDSNGLINCINIFEDADKDLIIEKENTAYKFVKDNFNKWEYTDSVIK